MVELETPSGATYSRNSSHVKVVPKCRSFIRDDISDISDDDDSLQNENIQNDLQKKETIFHH